MATGMVGRVADPFSRIAFSTTGRMRVRRGALVALIGIGLVTGAGPASADCNMEGRPLRTVSDARGLTFTGTLSSVRHGAGETLTFDVDDVFAGRAADAHRLRSPDCTSLWYADAGTLVVGDRYFVSTGSPDQPGIDNTIVYAKRGTGSWSLVEYSGQPVSFRPTMTLAALLDLTAPQALPPTSTAIGNGALGTRPPLGLAFAGSLLVGAWWFRRRPGVSRSA